MTKRDILPVILLGVFTCGIYSIYWFYVTAQELDKECSDKSEPLMNYVLAFLLGIVTCGIFLIYWEYKFFQKADKVLKTDNWVLNLVLSILFSPIVGMIITQDAINKYSKNDAEINVIE